MFDYRLNYKIIHHKGGKLIDIFFATFKITLSRNYSFLAGYGYITPQTRKGQILCIFVSLLGIPITMLTLKSVGEVIANVVSATVTKFEKKILKRLEPKQVQTKSAVILFSLMNVSFIIGGLLQVWKHLTLVEGVYFWFVTCTTIGFGDYVPYRMTGRIQRLSPTNPESFEAAEKHHISVTIFFMLECVIDLCIVSSVLNSIMAAIEEWNWRPRCPRCVPPRKTRHLMEITQNSTAEKREAEKGTFEMEHCA